MNPLKTSPEVCSVKIFHLKAKDDRPSTEVFWLVKEAKLATENF